MSLKVLYERINTRLSRNARKGVVVVVNGAGNKNSTRSDKSKSWKKLGTSRNKVVDGVLSLRARARARTCNRELPLSRIRLTSNVRIATIY